MHLRYIKNKETNDKINKKIPILLVYWKIMYLVVSRHFLRKNMGKARINYAPVICIPGSLGAGDSGDIAGPKCRDLIFD